jgi:PAS domain S-box-containing protein
MARKKPKARKTVRPSRPAPRRAAEAPPAVPPPPGGPTPRAELESRLRFETLLADLSSKFINLPAGAVDHAIDDAQRRVCEALGFDASALWQWTDSVPRIFTITHLHRPGGGSPPPERPDAQKMFPWSLQQLMAGKIVSFFVDTPPTEAVVDQATYRHYSIQSSLTIPLAAGGGPLLGAVSFNAMRAVRAWPPALVDRLQMVAQIFGNALARKASDLRLRKSEAQLATAVDLAELAFYEEDGNERFLLRDNRIRDLLGLVPGQQEGIRAHWATRIHPDDRDRMMDVSRRVRTAGLDRVSAEYRYLHPQRGTIWLTHLVHVLERDAGGKVVRTVGVLQDITPRKQAEAEIQRLRQDLSHVARVATLGELVSAFAHELNQPLGAILTNAEAAEILLRADPPDLAEALEILADIRRDDERAGEIIRRIRGFLRKRDTERIPLDANDLVRDVIRLVRNDAALREVAVETGLAPELPPLRGERIPLQQVLVNLAINAMDAMADAPVGKRKLAVRTARTGSGAVEVSVTDSGTGISAERIPHIFEPFYSTKPNGLGMGLPISRTIVEAHDGRIAAENNPGGGATFRVLLPPDGKTLP